MEFTDNGTPKFIYGTAWKEDNTEKLTNLAIKNGFRAIDTANQRKHYHEAGVGDAIANAINEELVDRSDLFLQTKFTYERGQDHRLPYDSDASHDTQVEQSLESSLKHLQTEYIDSLVLHGPSTRSGLGKADRTVWRTLESLVETDKVEHIGISNVSPDQLEKLIDFADKVPSYVQNRCFARQAWDKPSRDICNANGLTYQGFSLLTANQRELQTDEIRTIAEKHEKTIPQIVFRFALEVGMIPLTGTTSEKHMKQDLACLDFKLSKNDVETIETVAIN